MDAYDSQKLQEIILMDRKRYTVLVSLLCKTMAALAEHSETTIASIRPHEKRWSELSRAENVVPERLQQLISSKPVITNTPPPSPRESREDLTPVAAPTPAKKEEPPKKDKAQDKDDKKKKKEEEERKKKEKKDKGGKKEDAPLQRVQGLYQWVPRAVDELAIEVGMEVTLIEEVNEEWWLCSDGIKSGLVPSNYVKKI